MLAILTDPSSDTLFILCVLMFLAGLLTANLPWPRRNRRAEELESELDELRMENEQLAEALDGHDTGAAVAEMQGAMDELSDQLDRERAARTMAEESLKRREAELAENGGPSSPAGPSSSRSSIERCGIMTPRGRRCSLCSSSWRTSPTRPRIRMSRSRRCSNSWPTSKSGPHPPKEALQRLEEKHGSQTAVLESSQQEAASLRQELMEQQQQNRQFQHTIEELQQTNIQLQAALDEQRNSYDAASSLELQQLKEQVDVLKAERGVVSRERDALQLEISEARNTHQTQRPSGPATWSRNKSASTSWSPSSKRPRKPIRSLSALAPNWKSGWHR